MIAIRRFAAYLLLLVASLVSIGAGDEEVVLCLAFDGHVALEAGLDRCSDVAAQVQQDKTRGEPTVDTSADCCGPCSDVPLGSAPYLVNGTSGEQGSGFDHVATTVPAAPPLLVPGESARRLSAPAASLLRSAEQTLRTHLRC